MQKTHGILAALLSLLMLLTMVAGAREKKKKDKSEDTIYGTIGCSIPAPPPPKGSSQTPADSVALCLARQGKAVIVEDGSRNETLIDNPDAVIGYEGHRVSVSGYTNGDSFHIVSLRTI